MDWWIREARKLDYYKVLELYEEFVGEKKFIESSNDSLYKVLDNKNVFLYVLENKEELMGFICFSFRDVVRYPREIMEIEEIFVREKYRGNGYSKILMEKAMDIARRRNCYCAFVCSEEYREVAHKLYESFGFVKNRLSFKKKFD